MAIKTIKCSLRNPFALLWHKSFCESNNPCSFKEIIGHGDIKKIFVKAIGSNKPVHLLLYGSPGSAKTMFLTEMVRSLKSTLFVVGRNTTKAGILNQLFEGPKFLLIDELDKMSKVDQASLLNLMESGIISETKFNKTRQLKRASWVFATANSREKIISPLLSRFAVLEVPIYTYEQFKEIALTRLAKEKVDKYVAQLIVENVWSELGSDIRDVIKVGRLCESIEDVSFIIKMMKSTSRAKHC
jgi:holliday junction DNA helicase RuvB